jgi:predicted ester cyclase
MKMSANQTADQNKEIIRNLYEEILNTGKWELLAPVIAEDYVGVAGQKGPSAFAETIRGLRHGFPDIQWKVEDLVAEGDKVTVRWSWQGTHSNTFMGIQPTSKLLNNHAIAIYQLRDNQIIHAWLESDRLGFLQQIGMIPQDLGSFQQSQRDRVGTVR